MAEITRYHPRDRQSVELLYRRVFGHDAANANRLRWHWQYDQNPSTPAAGPLIWLAHEGPTVIGHYAAMPVRVQACGRERFGAWGLDVMVAPERQRQGIGEALLRAWEREVEVPLGLGLSPGSRRLLDRLRWPPPHAVPCLAKPLTRRALRRPSWPMPVNRFVSALTLPLVRVVSRARPLPAQIEPIRHFDSRFDDLWARLAPAFDLAVRRDAAYLNWKFVEPPHVRYSIVALKRDETVGGYAVYRHVQEPMGRVTLLVDFLADPADAGGLMTLLRWVDREARAADSDKIRCYATYAGYRKIMRGSGYFPVRSDLEVAAKAAGGDGQPGACGPEQWHVTLGDSDQDR